MNTNNVFFNLSEDDNDFKKVYPDVDDEIEEDEDLDDKEDDLDDDEMEELLDIYPESVALKEKHLIEEELEED